MKTKRTKNRCSGSSDNFVLLFIVGLGIAISVGWAALNWIKSVKDARMKALSSDHDKPPPKTVEDIGGYEVKY